MSNSNFIAVLAILFVCTTWRAVAEVPEKTRVYPTYTVTTSGGTNDLAAAQVEVLSAEGADPVTASFSSLKPLTQGTFIKKGEGFLNLTTDMGRFFGEFWVEEGALVVTQPGQLGPNDKTAGAVWVADGASLGLDVRITFSGQVMNLYNAFYIKGTGYEGKGALYNDSLDANVGYANMCACFKGKIGLYGDASFGGVGGKWGDGKYFTGYYLNGYTLTVACKGQYRTNGAGGFYPPGHIVVTGGGLNPQSGLDCESRYAACDCRGESHHRYAYSRSRHGGAWCSIYHLGRRKDAFALCAAAGNICDLLLRRTLRFDLSKLIMEKL